MFDISPFIRVFGRALLLLRAECGKLSIWIYFSIGCRFLEFFLPASLYLSSALIFPIEFSLQILWVDCISQVTLSFKISFMPLVLTGWFIIVRVSWLALVPDWIFIFRSASFEIYLVFRPEWRMYTKFGACCCCGSLKSPFLQVNLHSKRLCVV